jgi:hypothetical protein
VYTDANIVMGAESADFFFDCCYLKVIRVSPKLRPTVRTESKLRITPNSLFASDTPLLVLILKAVGSNLLHYID